MTDKRKRLFSFQQNRPWADGLIILMQLGLTMAGSILFCLYVGIKLDQWIGTKGVFTSIFILLGIIGGGYTVYRQIMENLEEKKNKK